MTDITAEDRLEALALLAETRLERIEKQQAEIDRLNREVNNLRWHLDSWEKYTTTLVNLLREIRDGGAKEDSPDLWRRIDEAIGDVFDPY